MKIKIDINDQFFNSPHTLRQMINSPDVLEIEKKLGLLDEGRGTLESIKLTIDPYSPFIPKINNIFLKHHFSLDLKSSDFSFEFEEKDKMNNVAFGEKVIVSNPICIDEFIVKSFKSHKTKLSEDLIRQNIMRIESRKKEEFFQTYMFEIKKSQNQFDELTQSHFYPKLLVIVDKVGDLITEKYKSERCRQILFLGLSDKTSDFLDRRSLISYALQYIKNDLKLSILTMTIQSNNERSLVLSKELKGIYEYSEMVQA
jgi:hypothetical protein